MPEGEPIVDTAAPDGLVFDADIHFGDEEPVVEEPSGEDSSAKSETSEEAALEASTKTEEPAEDKSDRLRHEDYTRKTQALAEERKAFERESGIGKEFLESIQTPEGLKHLREQLDAYELREFGRTQSTQSDIEYSEEGLALKATIEAQSKAIRDLMGELKTIKESALPEIESIRAEKRLMNASSELKSAHGVDVPPAKLREFMESTGETDPIKAYKLATYDDAIRQSYSQGHQKAASKPAIPKGNARGVDADDENSTADDIFVRMVLDSKAQANP